MPALDVTDLTSPAGMPGLVLDAVSVVHRAASEMADEDAVRTARLVAGSALLGQGVLLMSIGMTGDPSLIGATAIYDLSMEVTRIVTKRIAVLAAKAARRV